MDLAESLTPCTYSQGGTCSIFPQLNEINGLLRQIKLELRETSPGTLSLTQAPYLRLRQDIVHDQQPWAWHLLDAVLQKHLCVISLYVDEHKDPTGIPFDILIRKVPSLVMLRLRAVVERNEGLSGLAGALMSAHCLQNLRLEAIFLNADCVRLLSNYFSTTASLGTLSLAHTHVDPSVAEQLLMALEQNCTIRTLLLSACLCFRGVFLGHGSQLANCLSANATLQSLILDRCCFDCTPGLRVIMDALRTTRRLSTLYLIGFTNTKAFAELMPLIISENDALRSLKVVPSEVGGDLCECYLNYKCASCEVDYTNSEVGNISSITNAIAHNRWLQHLTVDLSKSFLEECWNFFQALRQNTTLSKVSVVGIRNEHAHSICQMIREGGLESRISLQCALNVQEPVEALIPCRKMTSICINAMQPECSQLLSRALMLLPFWGHVIELTLRLGADGLVKGHGHLVPYLEQTTKLRDFKLKVDGPVTLVHIRRRLLTAIFRNVSIRKLHIDRGLITNLEEAQALASALCGNNTLCEFSLFCDSDLSLIDELLRSLALGLQANRTLCWLHHTQVYYTPHYNAVQDVLRRNRAMATCAAHFVVGTKRTQRCAEAFHYVSDTPGLIDYVMQTASIDEMRAAYAIRKALSSNIQDGRISQYWSAN
ncbi:NLR family CARD domain-containing protein 3-like [Dermacentor albipictus]|uniref:NLR family CARD domain-containing protein 3-like n=1 Tax=Dermacentor albipictus TaxID=60249 RepID=UPI0031FBD38A